MIRFRFGIGLSILFLVSGVFQALADQAIDHPIKESSAPSMCSGRGGPLTISRDVIMQDLGLERYQAARGNLEACHGDEDCLQYAKEFKSLQCISEACDKNAGSQGVMDCVPDVNAKYNLQQRAEISTAICHTLKFNDDSGIKVLANYFPKTQPGKYERMAAFISAIKGNAKACQGQLIGYVGVFGPKWTFAWYRDLAACSILAGDSTPEEIGKDFYTWLGVARGLGTCSAIDNPLLRRACKSPDTCPLPMYAQ